MATLLFDFDSTLIRTECLDCLLDYCAIDTKTKARIAEITQQGMEGHIPFFDSLQQRLTLAQPSRAAIDKLAENMPQFLSANAANTIQTLQQQHDIWIISGGIQDLIEPVAKQLNIPLEQVHGVTLQWDKSGFYTGINTKNPFCHSKISGINALQPQWQHPVIAIGDGKTDHDLLEAGIADQFIAYTEHCKRQFVESLHLPQATDMHHLQILLQDS